MGTISTGTIDATDIADMAFSMPRDGTLTSVAAFFSTTVPAFFVGTTVTVHAQVYTSTTPDNTFTLVPGTDVVLAPALTGTVGTGTICNAILPGLSIPLTAETRVLVVFYITSTGASAINSVVGYASAGLAIS